MNFLEIIPDLATMQSEALVVLGVLQDSLNSAYFSVEFKDWSHTRTITGIAGQTKSAISYLDIASQAHEQLPDVMPLPRGSENFKEWNDIGEELSLFKREFEDAGDKSNNLPYGSARFSKGSFVNIHARGQGKIKGLMERVHDLNANTKWD